MGFMFVFVWLRGTLPRLRYDQFMHLGWKVLIPFNLGWIVAVAAIRIGATAGWVNTNVILIIGAAILVVLVVLVLTAGRETVEVRSEVSRVPAARPGPFDPFADGYPVPPMPGQALPEPVEVLVGPPGQVIDLLADADQEA
jgi:NADH-quinone oxidoreductase subunit H